jgi:hypothetical protein
MNERTVADRPSNVARRATGYLRWYPRVWRSRYGVEFQAHLEAEIEERPISISRALDIALHGVMARFRFQRGARWITGAVLSAVVVVALVVGFLGNGNRGLPVPLTIDTSSSVGMPTSPATVNNLNFRFTNRKSERIQLTHVSLIGFRDYPVPHIVRVELDPEHQRKDNYELNPSNALYGLVPAVGRSLKLGDDDSLFVRMVAPKKGRLYAVSGIRLTYVRHGVSRTESRSIGQMPDVLCVEKSSSQTVELPSCQRGIQTVWALAQFYAPPVNHQSTVESMAQIVTTAAFGFTTGAEKKVPALSDMRTWATHLFAHRGSWRVARVTAARTNVTIGNATHELTFHFAFVNRASGAKTNVCVQNGAYMDGGEITPQTVSCPSVSG